MLVHQLPQIPEPPPRESPVLAEVDTFADSTVAAWLSSVARRTLTAAEQLSIPIMRFRGAEGLASLSRGHYVVEAQIPRDHESLLWRVQVDDVEITTVLSTPSNYRKVFLEESDTSLLIVLVLSGSARVVTPRSRRQHSPGSLFQLLPGEPFSLRAEGVFSAVTLRLHQTHLTAQALGCEPCRLHAAIEIGRTVLVEHLTQPLTTGTCFARYSLMYSVRSIPILVMTSRASSANEFAS